MRVVTERIPTLKSVTVGIWVNTGSRDEQPAQAGYSHFIEHMFFKGTRSRSATEISREIDGLGGEMNAFTTRETTTFYVKFLTNSWRRPSNSWPICFTIRVSIQGSRKGEAGRPRGNTHGAG